MIFRITIVKMVILLKTIFRFNAIPIEILAQFFTVLKRKILSYMWKKNRITKAIS